MIDVAEFFSSFHFLRPWLLLLLIIPAGFYFVLFQKNTNLSSWEKVCDKILLNFLLIKGQHGQRKLSVVLMYVGLIGGILAVAGPSWQKTQHPSLVNENPMMILLNLSSDMQQDDVSPNRLGRAKIDIVELLNAAANSESGLIVYTAEPFLISPLSTDSKLISNLLPVVNRDIMPANGDRLDRAIDLAVEKIQAAGFGHGNIVIFSANAGVNFDLSLKAAKQAAAKGIKVNTVGVSASTNPQLPKIAAAGDGIAINGGSFQTMVGFAKKIMEDKSSLWREGKNQTAQWEDYGYFLLFIPFLCCLYFFRKGILVVVVLISFGSAAQAGFFFNDNQEGERYFHEEKYAEAAKKFKDRQWLATALYRQGKYDEAAQNYIQGKDVTALYNQGNALAKGGKIAEAIATYEQVLKQDPSHKDAQYNLDYLKQQQQQQQQQSSSSQQSQDKQKDEQQNQQQQAQQSGKSQENQEPKSTPDEQQKEDSQSQNDESSAENSASSEQKSNQTENQEPDSKSKQQPVPAQMEEQKSPAGQAKEGDKKEDYDEQAQAREQRFRNIPEDTGGLLRSFIYKEYTKNRYGD